MEAEKPSQLSQINRIVRFLGQGESGIMFATCIYPGLIREISEIIRERMQRENIPIGNLHLELDSELTLPAQIEYYFQENEDIDALVVFGLAGFLDHNGDQHLTALNFARESLLALGKPILIWATEKKLTLIMNQAADLYSQRTYSTVFFEGVPEDTGQTNPLPTNLEDIAQNDQRSLELRINLLMRQRDEATKRSINLEKRFRDYDLPLVEAYRKSGRYEEAIVLLSDLEASTGDMSPLSKIIFWRVYGDVYGDLRILEKAKDAYHQSISIGENQVKTKTDQTLLEIAGAYNNLGLLYSAQGEFEKGKEQFDHSLAIWKKLAEKNPEAYQMMVTLVLNNIGVIFANYSQDRRAYQAFKEAADIQRSLVEKNPTKYAANLAFSLSNLGAISWSLNQLSEARTYLKEALEIERKLAKDNPDEHLGVLSKVLTNFGNLLRTLNEFGLANAYLEESLSIYRNITLKNPDAFLPGMAKTLHFLGLLHAEQDHLDQAESNYLEALKSYDTLGTENFLVETISLKNNLSNLNLSKGNPHAALGNLVSALALVKELMASNPSIFFPEMALIEINLARLLLWDLNDSTTAKIHLQTCLEACAPHLETSPMAKEYAEKATDLLAQIEG